MYVVKRGKTIRLGRQQFVSSGELSELSSDDEENLQRHFLQALRDRSFQIGDLRATALCCGEINLISGRVKPTFRWPDAENEINGADIVVNPTHDRMGNAGTLDKKRKLLSKRKGGRARIYVSSSNWNTHKPSSRDKKRVIRQKPEADTLHTIYRARTRIVQERHHDSAGRYEYRWADVGAPTNEPR